MLYLARGIETDHYWVVQEVDGVLVETPWRIENEAGNWVLSHADSQRATEEVLSLGGFSTPEAAVSALRRFV